MASDRGRDRYSDPVALETLLRFENCSSSHCLWSSWRGFHVFEVVTSLASSYCFLRGSAGFSSWRRHLGLCRRRVIFMSSCRRVSFFAWYLDSVTLLPCYSVTLLPCYPVTLLPCYSVTLLLSYLVTL